MDTSMGNADASPSAVEGNTAAQSNAKQIEQNLSAPPSDSTGLSSAPRTDSEPKEPESDSIVVAPRQTMRDADPTSTDGTSDSQRPAQPAEPISQGLSSAAQAEVNGRATLLTAPEGPASAGTPNEFAIPAAPASGSTHSTPGGRGGARGGRGRGGLLTNGDATAPKVVDGTPVYGRGRGRGRGGGGRPRGSGRRRGGRGGKRKRGDDDDDDDDDDDEDGDSDTSVEITPIATETRSGRSIQKPTTFVPPPPPPSPTTNKRKRPYNHRNPQAAVCKVCLRGTSPASNPVVFCDGCNGAYHRWCHKPPIEQVVIEREDAEWFCQHCSAFRVVPVPAIEVTEFVSVSGASEDQRRKYFASLPQGMLVTLLTKATTFRPDLPVFDSKFKELVANSKANGNGDSSSVLSIAKGKESATTHRMAANGSRDAAAVGSSNTSRSRPPDRNGPWPDDAAYTDDIHPENYPRPGQGLMSTLPPETEDLEWLVDDDDKYGVFTHVYHQPPKTQAGAAQASTKKLA